MKKTCETPIVEKIAFNYRDQVVAASSATVGICKEYYTKNGGGQNEVCGGNDHSANREWFN